MQQRLHLLQKAVVSLELVGTVKLLIYRRLMLKLFTHQKSLKKLVTNKFLYYAY